MMCNAGVGSNWRALLRRPFKDARRALIDHFEREYLRALLAQNRGSLSATARQAGLDRKHLRRLVRKHGLRGGAAVMAWMGTARAT
jgi:DNA-binding NtrC family response regulator